MSIRKGTLSSVDHLTGLTSVNLIDKSNQPKQGISVTQPYIGRGWGIRAGVEEGTGVLVEENATGELFILGYLANPQFSHNLSSSQETAATLAAPKFKNVQEGEIAIQSMSNSLVFLDKMGNINLNTADGISFELNKATDSINQLSVNHNIYTESSSVKNGLVRRDTRTEQQKNSDLFITSIVGADFQQDELQDIIGVDPQHRVQADNVSLQGVFDPTTGTSKILSIPGITGIPQAATIAASVTNPAVTEYSIEVNEFSDGLAGINPVEQTAESKKAGRLTPNLAAKFVLGTVVNQNGRLSRFDYVFGNGSPKGHGDIWKLPGINETNASTDFKVDEKLTVSSPAILSSASQWAVGSIERFNTAIAFQLVLNTRGADSKGKIPNSSSVGSVWSLQVDKEGLTKWNIPASTSLSNKEPFRTGRSLLMNADGSITLSVGKEKNADLKSITSSKDQSKFVNVVTERMDRSLTVDIEGSSEWRLGADFAGQSQMIEADGALSFYYGKMIGNAPSITKSLPSGLTSPSRSGNRIGTSITGKTAGSVELSLGVNTANQKQSLALNADGLMHITAGANDKSESFILDATGNIQLKTAGGGHKVEIFSSNSKQNKDAIIITHGTTKAFFQIDSNGVITLRSNNGSGTMIMSRKGDITLLNESGSKIALEATGTITLGSRDAGLIISPTKGVSAYSGQATFALTPAGKAEIAAQGGFTVTGSQAHLNTTGVLFGGGAATSPYRVAICGGGLGINPLTGTSETGFSLLGAIG